MRKALIVKERINEDVSNAKAIPDFIYLNNNKKICLELIKLFTWLIINFKCRVIQVNLPTNN